jgi:hypothetical protein
MERDEDQAASEGGDNIADALCARTPGEELQLVLGDQIDVFLDRVMQHRVYSLPCRGRTTASWPIDEWDVSTAAV